MILADTIVAISSAVAPAARLVVRLSGPAAIEQLLAIAPDTDVRSGYASNMLLQFTEWVVPAWVYIFRQPRSYTGDDLVEFHIPGNVLLARLLVEHLIHAGVRQAEAGEFTARAFLNGRLDLTAAEGVALAIHAQHADELRAARQLMAGELPRRLAPVMELLVDVLALVEAGIDFAEEDISFISSNDLHARCRSMLIALRDLTINTARIERLSHEPTFVLVGRPNAGKSTLLNTLAGHDRAVVSSIAGTTRDALSAHVTLVRGRVIVIDVAGIEPIAETNPARRSIAEQMQARARRAIEEADFVIHVIDATDPTPPLPLPRDADLVVMNKIDLAERTPSPELWVSAKTGDNVQALRQRMNQLAFGRSTASSALALNARHVDAIENAERSIASAMAEGNAAEVIAHDLRGALDSIGQVLGQVTPDDVLGKIFAGFCIGK